MWTPLTVVLLLVATGEGAAIAALLLERRRVALALGELRVSVDAALAAAERAAGDPPRSDPPPATRPIGFRRRPGAA